MVHVYTCIITCSNIPVDGLTANYKHENQLVNPQL